MQMCWLLCDENLGRLTDCFLYQELEDAGRQRFAKCDVLPAVFFGENTKVAPKVALSPPQLWQPFPLFWECFV